MIADPDSEETAPDGDPPRTHPIKHVTLDRTPEEWQAVREDARRKAPPSAKLYKPTKRLGTPIAHKGSP